MPFRDFQKFLFLFLVWFGLIFYFTFNEPTVLEWLNGWNRWDSLNFEKISVTGFTERFLIAYPPIYTLTVSFFSKLLGISFPHAGFLVSMVSFFLSGVLSCHLIGRRMAIPDKWLFVFYLSSPVAYFAFSAYSDCFFNLFLWILLFVTLERHRTEFTKAIESVLFFILPFIRTTGFSLLALICARRFTAFWVLPSLGFWFLYNYMIMGSPFAFLEAQKLALMPEGGFIAGFKYSWGNYFHSTAVQNNVDHMTWLQFHVLPVTYLLLLLACSVFLFIRNERVFAFAVLGICLISHNQSFWRSVVRYDYPVMVLLITPILDATFRKPKIFKYLGLLILLLFSGLQFYLQVLFANTFQAGGWGF